MKNQLKTITASILMALSTAGAADVSLSSGELSITTSSAGRITRIVQDSHSVLYEYTTFADTGSPGHGFALSGTVTNAIHSQDGAAVSSGEFRGDNGTIHWTATSTMNADGVHVTRWAFYSDQAFGSVDLLFYADLDIGHESTNALVEGGPAHAPQLLMTTNTNTDWGVALGVQEMHHAHYLGWSGGQYAHSLITGVGFTPNGAPSHWAALPGISKLAPNVKRWGPVDVSAGFGVRLDAGAKVAAFETTITGAPDGKMPWPSAPAYQAVDEEAVSNAASHGERSEGW